MGTERFTGRSISANIKSQNFRVAEAKDLGRESEERKKKNTMIGAIPAHNLDVTLDQRPDSLQDDMGSDDSTPASPPRDGTATEADAAFELVL